MKSSVRIGLLIILLGMLNARMGIAETGIGNLGFMLGDWQATRYFKDPRNNWIKADEKNVTFEMTGSGKFITADLQLMEDQRYIIFSWDPYQKKYRAVIMDHSTGMLDVYTGNNQSGNLVLTNGKGTFNVTDGKKIFNRYVIKQNDKGFTIETYRSVVGEETEWVKITKSEFLEKL